MKTAHLSSKRFAIAALGASALTIGAITTAAAQGHPARPSGPQTPVFTGVCDTTATKTKASKAIQSTTSTTFVDVIDTSIGFKQGSGTNSCVVVSFSSEAFTAANTIMTVEPVLDGVSCQPSGTFFAASSATPEPLQDHAMNWVCPNVSSGNHTVKMHFRSSGGQATLDYRLMAVHYRK